jgi:hypothetical protein
MAFIIFEKNIRQKTVSNRQWSVKKYKTGRSVYAEVVENKEAG